MGGCKSLKNNLIHFYKTPLIYFYYTCINTNRHIITPLNILTICLVKLIPMKKIYFILFALGFLNACIQNNQNGTQTNNKLPEINIDQKSTKLLEYNYSDVFENFEIICLETKDECLMRIPNRFKFSSEHIFLSYQTSVPNPAKAARFDRQGNFLNTIGKGGNGPGEHAGYLADNIEIDSSKKTVFIEWNQDPFLYDWDGKVIKGIKTPYEFISGIYAYKEDEYFSFGSASNKPYAAKDSVIIFFYNHKGNITSEIKRKVYPSKDSQMYHSGGWGSSYYKFNGKSKIYIPGFDTLYQLVNKKLIPDAIIKRGKNGMPYNKGIPVEEVVGKYYLSVLSETAQYIFMTRKLITKADLKYIERFQDWGGSFEIDDQLVFFNKESQKSHEILITDNVFKFFPKEFKLASYFYSGNNRYCIPIPAINFVEYIENNPDNIDHSKIKVDRKKLEALTENSNPIIITFTLKDKIYLN